MESFVLHLVVLLKVLLLSTAQDRPMRDIINSVEAGPGVGSDSIDVLWNLNFGITEVETVILTVTYTGPCSNAQLPPQQMILPFPSQTFATFTDLRPHSMYRINVTIVTTAAGVGTREVSTSTRGTAPSSSPTNLRFINASMTSITVAWDPIPCLDENSRIEEYQVEFASLADVNNRRTIHVPTRFTSASIGGLPSGSVFSIALTVVFSVNDEGPANRISDTPSINASTFSIPGPIGLRASVQNSTTVALSWQQEQPLNNLTGYDIEARYIGPCMLSQSPLTDRIPISSRIYLLENLVEFGMYWISITAVSVNGQTALAFTNVQTLPGEPQSAPSGLRASDIKAFTATISWNPIDCEDARSRISNYTLYYGLQMNYSNVTRESISGITGTSVNITRLSDVSRYVFQVEATNQEGLTSPISPILPIVTTTQPPPPSDLRVILISATSVLLEWNQTVGLSYTIMSTYIGPCSDVQIPPITRTVVGGSSGLGSIVGLQEFSNYTVTVTPEGGRLFALVTFMTIAADPTPADDHIGLVSTTNTSITLHIPQVNCIDQNGRIMPRFRIRYAQTVDFLAGRNIRNGLFSPGVVTVGNLLSGTQYTFELTIVTIMGRRRVTLQPLNASTQGMVPRITIPPTDANTAFPSTGSMAEEVVPTVIIVVVGLIMIAVATTLVIIYIVRKRRGSGTAVTRTSKRSDTRRLLSHSGSSLFEQESVKESPLFDSLDPSEFTNPNTLAFKKETMMNWMQSNLDTTYENEGYQDSDIDIKDFEPN